MKIAVDTNVLIRLIMGDDEAQGRVAIATMKKASMIAISVVSLCELAWVLSGKYGVSRKEVAAAIRALIDAQNVVVNRPLVDAGLSMLDAGGDFADGVIAHDGHWLGGDTFVTFDQKAAKLVEARGASVGLLR